MLKKSTIASAVMATFVVTAAPIVLAQTAPVEPPEKKADAP